MIPGLTASPSSGGSRISQRGDQPIIWHNFCRELRENEKKIGQRSDDYTEAQFDQKMG